ncbi:MAG: hypothetical protein ACJ77E_21175 [Gaiellaceae bacterium]
MRALLTIGTASVALTFAGAAASGAAPRAPSLRVVGESVHGRFFQSHEVVRLTFVADVRVVRRVRTSSVGTFAGRFPKIYDPCSDALVIRASGSRGDDAVLKLPKRLCPPQ